VLERESSGDSAANRTVWQAPGKRVSYGGLRWSAGLLRSDRSRDSFLSAGDVPAKGVAASMLMTIAREFARGSQNLPLAQLVGMPTVCSAEHHGRNTSRWLWAAWPRQGDRHAGHLRCLQRFAHGRHIAQATGVALRCSAPRDFPCAN